MIGGARVRRTVVPMRVVSEFRDRFGSEPLEMIDVAKHIVDGAGLPGNKPSPAT